MVKRNQNRHLNEVEPYHPQPKDLLVTHGAFIIIIIIIIIIRHAPSVRSSACCQ